ncbi:hypothetical protein [Chryseobacterium sp. JK1]|uniref:hypothetical protein n=1 Tax=Chryseobacterium sp. JK1 TaxID=874294 RepID=UPI003D68F688
MKTIRMADSKKVGSYGVFYSLSEALLTNDPSEKLIQKDKKDSISVILTKPESEDFIHYHFVAFSTIFEYVDFHLRVGYESNGRTGNNRC